MMIFSGTASTVLAASIAATLGLPQGRIDLQRFPDGEFNIEIENNLRGRDIYLVQSTCPPIADNLLELMLIADAMHRVGAGKITALIPYFGYARQDRRVSGSEPIGARVIASLLSATPISRIITVDIHNPSLEGFFNKPFENASAVPLLAEAAKKEMVDIVVSPDTGAVKLGERYGELLGLPVAIIHKTRISGSEVEAHSITGDVHNKRPLIVDDMISTAGTIEAAAKVLLKAECLPEICIAATHGLLVGQAVERLKKLPLKSVYLTNSISAKPVDGLPLEEIDLGPLLAEVIRRIQNQESIVDLLVHF
ncbi:MAG: ribose-phosphate pyrophosphokinase [Dehalococcoidales bacterium]|nr:ribose-phosphate pyrophosphokinase [Dehalococcoidales bacterium]